MRIAFVSFSLAVAILAVGLARETPFVGWPLPGQRSLVASGSVVRDLPERGIDGLDASAARRAIENAEASTYIGEILAEHDSAVVRWPEHRESPIAVWIQPRAAIAGFRPAYVEQVRRAFEEWDHLQLPIHFAFTTDSAAADVHVAWINRFSEPISGRTRWTHDDWMIADANILLAVHHHRGERLDDDAMHAMALHEIGHLLGLDHTHDTLSVMAPRVRVRELSDADRATARLLYALPTGPLQ